MKNAFRQGERIYLRPLEIEDLESLQGWMNDPEIQQFIARVLPINQRQEREWLEGLGKSENDLCLGIALKEEGRLIGSCGLHGIRLPNRCAELGITIGDKKRHGQGYGAEAMRLLCGFGFDSLGLHRIELQVYSYNRRAIRCYEKCGFRAEGLRREARFWEGRWHDVIWMSLLEHEFRGAPADGRLAGCRLGE